MRKIAVVLCGCGNQDGNEITETVSLIVALSEAGAQVQYFAPNIDVPARDFSEKPTGQTKNMLNEVMRFTVDGKVQDLKSLKTNDFDGLAIPGGMGNALNLSDWAAKGAQCTVLPEMEKAILEFHQQSKPIAAICMAPVLIARVLGAHHPTITLGNHPKMKAEVEKNGAVHEDCPVDDFITDRENKVITTPAYMHDAKPHEVFRGISGLVKEFIEMA